MDRDRASTLARWGAWLLAAGLILLVLWAALEFTPLGVREEPALPGKTENPMSPWNKPVPKWEYTLAHSVLIVVDTVLPVGGSLLAVAGMGLLLAPGGSSSARRSIATSLLGTLALVSGLALIGTTVWQWHVRTQRLEPADPGKTPIPIDHDSPFFGDFSDWTPQKSDAYFERMRRRDRLDRLWWRTVLYVFPPVGLLLSAIGVWLIAADHRKSKG